MKIISIVCLSIALILTSCKTVDEHLPGPTEEVPDAGVLAHVSGTVRSTSGSPISNASVHIVYEHVPVPLNRQLRPMDAPQFPSQALLFTYDTMRTECGGSTILPDGVTAKIFWDRDGDGIDNDDPQPPVCDHPPSCDDGPSQTVNYNQFLTNGAGVGVPGGFIVDVDFFTVGDVLVPNRYYVRIYCEDDNPLYTSQVVDIPQGYSDQPLTMTCSSCEGAPPVNAWRLDPAYPNPVLEETTIHFGLAEAAEAQIWLRRVGIVNYEIPINETLGGGFYDRVMDLSDLPNGAYIYALFAGSYQASDTLIKNVSDETDLRGTTAGAVTESNGTFTLNVPCDVTTDLRDEANQPLGDIILSRARIVAVANGYQAADTTLNLTPQTDFTIQLSLSPQ